MRRGMVIAGLIAVALNATGCGAHRAATNPALRVSGTPLSPSATRGRAIYADNCSACHGADAAGGQLGPTLRGERTRRTDAQIDATILDPTPPMPRLSPAQLSAQDIADVAAYVETL